MKTFLECAEEAARENKESGFDSYLIHKLGMHRLGYLERAADIYTSQRAGIYSNVMQAEGSDGAEGAAVASEGQGEANMSAEHLWELLRDLEMGKLSAKYVFDKVRSA